MCSDYIVWALFFVFFIFVATHTQHFLCFHCFCRITTVKNSLADALTSSSFVAMFIGEDTSLHPISLLSRTDTTTFSLYHSFFLVANNESADIEFRVPTFRSRIDDVESAVRYFITGLTGPADGAFGTFVITTSDGSRFYALWRGSPEHLFVAVSIFPLITFSRKLFHLLIDEGYRTISPVLNTLCEFPIVSCANMEYNIHLQGGSLLLSFNSLGLVNDDDMNMIALRMLTPQVMVDCWEALILENKVLVVSRMAAIVPYCCEFLRRLVLPLVVINTYVPFLPEELLNAIEAPFPYLLGAETEMVYNNRIDLSDTYVVDLDAHEVRPPQKTAGLGSAPINIKKKLITEINNILMQPLAAWVCRPVDPPEGLSSCPGNGSTNVYKLDEAKYEQDEACHPHSLGLQAASTTAVLRCFIRLNLSLFGARHCDVRAFYRKCDRPLAPKTAPCHNFKLPKHLGPDGKISSMGFSYRSGVVCGCMQLLNERKDIDVLQFLPCWVEMDTEVLAVHEYADEMPLIFVLIKDIVAVFPSPAEPEGHVFDLQLASQMTYRFAATDPESRQFWIQEIEKITRVSGSVRLTLQLSHHSSSQSQYLGDDSKSDAVMDDSDPHNDDEFVSLSKFRCNINQTQMVSFFKSRSEFHEYESILHEKDLGADNLTIGEVLTAAGSTSQSPPPPDVKEDTPKSSSTDAEDSSPVEGAEDNPLPPRMLSADRSSSRFALDYETTMCSAPVIENIKILWGLYVTGELDTDASSASPYLSGDASQLRRNGVSFRRNSINTESSFWLSQSPLCQTASMSFLSKGVRNYSTFQKRKLRASVESFAEDADKQMQQAAASTSLFSSIMRPFQSKPESVST
jgi:hypothetical protein